MNILSTRNEELISKREFNYSLLEGMKELNLNIEEKYLGKYYKKNTFDNIVYEEFCFSMITETGDKEYLVSFTISEKIVTDCDLEEIINCKGYWSLSQLNEFTYFPELKLLIGDEYTLLDLDNELQSILDYNEKEKISNSIFNDLESVLENKSVTFYKTEKDLDNHELNLSYNIFFNIIKNSDNNFETIVKIKDIEMDYVS